MRASARLFDEAIEKRGKQDVQVINEQFLKSSFNFAGFNTASADVHFSNCSMIVYPYALNIRIPLSLRVDIRVADFITGNLAFSADFTLSGQSKHLLLRSLSGSMINAPKPGFRHVRFLFFH